LKSTQVFVNKFKLNSAPKIKKLSKKPCLLVDTEKDLADS